MVTKMRNKANTSKATLPQRLNSKACSAMFKRTREAADKALERYGEPDMSLPDMSLVELRQILAERLSDFSLSDWLIKERAAGW